MKQEAAKKKESTAKGILLDTDRKSPRASEFDDRGTADVLDEATQMLADGWLDQPSGAGK